jgi:hypothetical protein
MISQLTEQNAKIIYFTAKNAKEGSAFLDKNFYLDLKPFALCSLRLEICVYLRKSASYKFKLSFALEACPDSYQGCYRGASAVIVFYLRM